MSDTPSVTERITAYLKGGGLFNPDLANHDAVRDLLIDCREALAAALKAKEEAERDAQRYRWLREHHQTDVRHRLTWYLPRTQPLNEIGLDAAIDQAMKK